jgi:exonuclease III
MNTVSSFSNTLLHSRIEVTGTEYDILNIYNPVDSPANKKRRAETIEEASRILQALIKEGDRNIIIGGDFNFGTDIESMLRTLNLTAALSEDKATFRRGGSHLDNFFTNCRFGADIIHDADTNDHYTISI